jgi:Glycosyl transferase family 8
MKSFFEWFETTKQNPEQPWLVLGKGPSFAKRDQFDLKNFQLLSLNHAVREQPVAVAHMIDFDVVEACGESIDRNATVLVMPWFPHLENRPGTKNLESLARRNSTLNRLNTQGRLLWYNHSLAREMRGNSPVIPVRFFSSEAVLNLLAAAGVRQVRSLGIDGGYTYSAQFQDLAGKTLLSNQRTTFDVQFGEIAKILMNTGLDYAPLDVQSPVRVYVAATEAQMLAVRVLEYSIRKHASLTVQVRPLHLSGIEIPTPAKPENRPRTPFSFQRFLIPALTGYQGRAIYLDSDMQVFQDIRRLWNVSFENADLLAVQEPGSTGRRPQFSVMVLNCASLRWDIEEIVQSLNEGALTYERLMYDMAVASKIRASLDPAWNSLERYNPEQTCLLHYTDMNTQPWLASNNPLGYLWIRDLFEAIDRKFLSESEIADHVQRGFVRPSLLYQVEHRIEDSFVLPRKARQMDQGFVPPFSAGPLRQSSPWLRPSAFLRAAARGYLQNSLVFRASRKVRSLFRAS